VSEAQYWLGWQTESGPLLPHDALVARGWYERAAVGRHRLALERLARAYEAGELGLTPDPQAALRLRAEIRRCAEEQAAAGPAG
jgi:TPR repeat protein